MTKEICTCDRCGCTITPFYNLYPRHVMTVKLFDASATTDTAYIEKTRELIEKQYQKEIETYDEPIEVEYETAFKQKYKKYDLCKSCRKELNEFLEGKK